MRDMRLQTRISLLSATLAAIVLALAVSISAASSPLKITNCTKATSRPKALTLACADANTVLRGLSWSSFGGATAQAKGTLELNKCEPNCAAGKFSKYPIKATASGTRTCKGGLRVYSRLSLRFTGKSPASANTLKSWKLSCPI
jgi:hypothetical protein